jgi:hypothetical protein
VTAVATAANYNPTTKDVNQPRFVIQAMEKTTTEQRTKLEEESVQSVKQFTPATFITLPGHTAEEGKERKLSGKVDKTNARIVDLNKKTIDKRYPRIDDADPEQFEEQTGHLTRRIKACSREALSEVGKLRGSPAGGLQLQVRMDSILKRLIKDTTENMRVVLAIKGLH